MDGSQLGIICSTTGQWVREDNCKAANYTLYHDAKSQTEKIKHLGEFCTGPSGEKENGKIKADGAVKYENRKELCVPGTVDFTPKLSWLR